MKSIHSKTVWLSIWGVIIFASMLFASCEGPAGKDGLAGKDGTDGKDGADGTQNCGTCHDASTDLFAKQLQWAASQHAVGTNFERSGTSCAPCHTSEGFREVAETGLTTTAAAINNPSGQNCRTCHKIHETHTDADWALTYTGTTKLQFTKTEIDLGKGSLCGQCHQARPLAAMVDLTAENYEVKVRFGPHHSSAANMFAGSGAFEIPGTEAYGSTAAHQNIQNACVNCHMGPAYGVQAGGHSLKMTYEYSGKIVDNVAVCTPCHSSATSFDVNSVQEEVLGLIIELRGKLADLGMLKKDASDNPSDFHSDAAIPGVYSSLNAAVLYNYLYLVNDKSWGVHNPKYTRAVVKNSLQALN
ncbi:MAG: hypothetical protein CVV22_08350 [Ignavibacteriae bacterium HGW-Ignavibacteriae-1]|nr:MAG: hypothetical protein CVV22_08350 [Ignavibacteriae bacterium HGW-Ignavibacteriae-1]